MSSSKMIANMDLDFPLIAPTPGSDPQPFEDMDYVPSPPVLKWFLDEESTEPETDVAEYAEDITDYYRQRQTFFKIGKYFDKHLRLDHEIRAEMVNFMAEITTSKNMYDEVLFLAVKLFDIYLENCEDVIYYKQLKLISSTAVYVAAKFEANCFNYPISDYVEYNIGKYFGKHLRLDHEIRAEMVNFMAELTTLDNMFDDILFLAVKLFDTYLEYTDDVIYHKQLKLISSTAVYLAAKFEANCFNFPISKYVECNNNMFTAKEFRVMEGEILKSVGFEVGIPTSQFFLGRFSKIVKAHDQVDAFACYVLNMALMFYEFVDVKDDILAAGALYLAYLTIGRPYNPALDQYTGYTTGELEPIAKALNHMLYKCDSFYKNFKAIENYYDEQTNHFIATIEYLPCDRPPHVDIEIPKYALNV